MIVLCGPKDGPGFEEAFYGISAQKIHPRHREHRPGTFEDEFQRVKGIQPALRWNPRRPKLLAAYLYNEVIRAVKALGGGESTKNLRLFSTLGTHVDYKFGTDGVFELDQWIATFDLTTKADKEFKADVLVTRGQYVRDMLFEPAFLIARRLMARPTLP